MMKKYQFLFGLVLCLGFFQCKGYSQVYNEPLAHTYSIVARDPVTGDLGVAVQSHWFSVGTIVSWGEAGVGVIATQSMVNASFGPRGLALLKEGKSPQEVVDILLSSDEGRALRQLAVLDMQGRVASYTGEHCIAEAGNLTGDGYSVQANMMLNATVWPAMAKAFESSSGPLAERLLTALKAAEQCGGDIRGRQSVALLVVRGKSTGNVWEDRLVDIQIADHPYPLVELERILKMQRAYEHMNQGDLAMEQGSRVLAMQEYGAAEQMFPENLEMKFWHAVSLANAGEVEEALSIFQVVFRKDEQWRELTKRLIKPGLLNVSEQELNRIVSLE
jgi:uncharacterized Ntn-hydrolase superfamily protein